MTAMAEGIIPFQSIVAQEVELVTYFILICKNERNIAHTNIHAHTLTSIKECIPYPYEPLLQTKLKNLEIDKVTICISYLTGMPYY